MLETTEIPFASVREMAVLKKAAGILAKIEMRRSRVREEKMTNPETTKRILTTMLRCQPHESFVMLALDSQHRLIAEPVELFRGTIDGASVFPREVIKAALELNAAAVIFAHNHPSGVAEPSLADRQITRRLVDGLALVDIRVLDHFIVGDISVGKDNSIVSFAERGLI